jgi:AAA family ATP:ADP antiporter
MLVSAGLLVASLGLTYLVHRREAGAGKKGREAKDEPLAPGSAFGLIAGDRYLLAFAVLVLVLNMVTKTGDFVLDTMLVKSAHLAAHAQGVTPDVYIGEFKARYFEWINGLGVIMQLFVVSRVIKYAGMRFALVLVPLASVAGYGVALAAPLIGVLTAARVAESTLDYSLSNTSRQALWLVTSPEAKYKAKQVIDTFVMRAGDSLSAGLVWIGVRTAMTTREYIAVNVALTALWLGLALLIGRMFTSRSAASRLSRSAEAKP